MRTIGDMGTLIKKIFAPQTSANHLLQTIEQCRRNWHAALANFNQCEPNMIDYMIFQVNAAERQYISLLKQAQQMGLTAWSDGLTPSRAIERHDNKTNPYA